MAAAVKVPVRLLRADGGWDVIPGEVTKKGVVAIHDSLDGGGGWVLSLVSTGRVLLRARLKKGARLAQRELELLEWADPESNRARLGEIRTLAI